MAKKQMVMVLGIPKIDRALRELEPRVAKKVLRQQMRKSLKPVQADAKNNAPVLQEPKEGRIAGALKKSIKVRSGKRTRKGIVVNVSCAPDVSVGGKTKTGSNEFYGRFQEYGWKLTSHKPENKVIRNIEGKHFMRNAFLRKGEQAKQDALQGIKDGIEQEVKQLRQS